MKKNKIVTVPDMPQAVADQSINLIQQAIDLITPYKVIVGSPEEAKGFLRLSPEEAALSFTLNTVINNFSSVFGSAFPKASFQSAQQNNNRNKQILEKVEQCFDILNLRRLGINHNRKQGELQALPIVNQAIENGMSEFVPIKNEMNVCWSKTLHAATIFSIAGNEQEIVENVEGGTMFINSGVTSLNLLLGINEMSHWIEVLPKSEYDLPKDCKVITVKNLNETIMGEFRVRISTE